MKTGNVNQKKVYDQTAVMIQSLRFKGSITESEMVLLLNLLELVYANKHRNFMTVLHSWQEVSPDSEINDIIKETILQMDFTDNKTVAMNVEIIKELLHYNNSANN